MIINTDPAYWCGVIPQPAVPGVSEHGIIRAKEPCTVFVDWFSYVKPSINQKGESCVGWTSAHWFTAMQIRFGDKQPFEEGWYLDGQIVWERGRDMFWNGDKTGGLYLPQGFKSLADLGIVPNDSIILGVAPDWDSVGLALMETPIIQGHAIHKGWFSPLKTNGCIDHAPMASGANGYHCPLRVARLIQAFMRKFFALQNSWGEVWGFGGYGLMTNDEDKEGLMSPGLYTLRMPAGWTKDETWKKYLKKAA
jgi:hypothetical protein